MSLQRNSGVGYISSDFNRHMEKESITRFHSPLWENLTEKYKVKFNRRAASLMVTGVFLYPLNNIEDQRTGKELISQPTKVQASFEVFSSTLQKQGQEAGGTERKQQWQNTACLLAPGCFPQELFYALVKLENHIPSTSEPCQGSGQAAMSL